MYIEGVEEQAKAVATELAKLFQDTTKAAYGDKINLSWASKIESGIETAEIM